MARRDRIAPYWGADGLGELRHFSTGHVVVAEEIVARVLGRRLSYRLVSGLPLRDYRADIDLEPATGTTEHTPIR